MSTPTRGRGTRTPKGKGIDFDSLCFNPGCKDDGVVEYEIIDEYYPRIGVKEGFKHSWRGPVRRRFCEAHALRGDCGLEDADKNYVLISAPPGWKGNADLGAKAAESPSAQVSVTINNLDDLPAAIQAAKERHDVNKGTASD